MEPPVVPPGAEKSLKRLVALLDNTTQTIIRHRWQLEGAVFLTREQLGTRLKLTVGEVRRIEIAGREDLRSILTKEKWL